MNRNHRLVLFAFATALALPVTASAARLKDIGNWQGVQSNALVGHGLVVGLQGTGDGGEAVRKFVRNMSMLDVGTLLTQDFKTKNAAIVAVTATLPPFARAGDHIDVTVAAVQDARSLSGGVLLPTQLWDAGGNSEWALGSGPLTVGGFSAGANGAGAQKNHVTTARVPGGAKVTQSIAGAFEGRSELHFSLSRSDFTTAVHAARAVNRALLGDFARALDSSSIQVVVPPQYQGRVPEMVAALEGINVDTDSRARVVLNERTGTVVMGTHVRIHTVAVAHAGLTIQVDTQFGVSQPEPLSGGTTSTVADSSVSVTEDGGDLTVLGGVSIGEVVGALNQLGVAPRDLISILQAIHGAGAMDAEIEVL